MWDNPEEGELDPAEGVGRSAGAARRILLFYPALGQFTADETGKGQFQENQHLAAQRGGAVPAPLTRVGPKFYLKKLCRDGHFRIVLYSRIISNIFFFRIIYFNNTNTFI